MLRTRGHVALGLKEKGGERYEAAAYWYHVGSEVTDEKKKIEEVGYHSCASDYSIRFRQNVSTGQRFQ